MKKKTEQKARRSALRLLLMTLSLCLLLPVGLTACSSDDDDNTSGCYTAEVLDPNNVNSSTHIVFLKEIPQKDVSKGKFKKNTMVMIIEERPFLYKTGELISFKVINFKEFHGNQYLRYNIEYECVVEPCE